MLASVSRSVQKQLTKGSATMLISSLIFCASLSACSGDGPTANVATSLVSSTPASLLEQAPGRGDTLWAVVGESVLLGRAVSSRDRLGATSTYRVSDPALATIVRGTADVRAMVGPGTGIVSVSYGVGVSATTFWIRALAPEMVKGVRIVGLPDSLPVGWSGVPSIQAQLTDGASRSGVPGRISLSSTGVASISASGLLTTVSPGVFQLETTSLGKTVTQQVVVTGGPVTGRISASGPISTGAISSLTANFTDANGQAAACANVTWSQPSPAGVASLGSTSRGNVKTVVGLSPGAFTISATCNGTVTTTALFQVVASSSSAPSDFSKLSLNVVRLDSTATDSIYVSSGVPLPPGLLSATDLSSLRLLVGGVEVNRHISALSGEHPSGGLRSMLVQFSIPVSAATLPVVIERSGRTLPERQKSAVSSVPRAILMYSNLNDFVKTNIVGPTRIRSESPTSPAFFSKYDDDWDYWEKIQYSRNDSPGSQNYYDRVLAYFAFYIRTGNPEYFRKGAVLASRYRDEFVVPADYALPEWSAVYDGLAVHYWLTGADSSRTTVLKATVSLAHSHGGSFLNDIQAITWMDNRVQSRVLGTKVLSIMLGATSIEGFGWHPAIPNLRAAADSDLTRILSVQRIPEGAYRFPGTCNESSNFMTGLLNGTLGLYYDQVRQDSRIPPAVLASYSWLKSTQWVPSAGGFQYYSGVCLPYGDMNPAGDLAGLFLDGLGFLYRYTKDPQWLAFGDEVMAGAVRNAYLNGTKQFNEHYQMSWRWLGSRDPLR